MPEEHESGKLDLRNKKSVTEGDIRQNMAKMNELGKPNSCNKIYGTIGKHPRHVSQENLTHVRKNQL